MAKHTFELNPCVTKIEYMGNGVTTVSVTHNVCINSLSLYKSCLCVTLLCIFVCVF